MRAIAAWPASTAPRVVELAEPAAPQAGEVLCRTVQLGICGTDRDILHSADPCTPPQVPFLVLGHECLGRVESVGPGVGGVAPGGLVVPVVRRPLPQARGRVDLLPLGHYTERGIVAEHGFSAPWWLDRPEYLFPVPDRLEPVAVFVEPVAVAEKGFQEAALLQRARLGDQAWTDPPPRVLITGLGPIGFAALLAAQDRRWPASVYGRDRPDSFRAQLVQELGGTYLPEGTLDPEPADTERDGFDLLLECTGSEEVLLAASRWLAACGVAVWLGSSRQSRPASLDVARLMRDGLLRNQIHLGSVNAAPRDFRRAIDLLDRAFQTRPKTVEAVLTHRVAPHESLPHFQGRLPQAIKTVLMYDRAGDGWC